MAREHGLWKGEPFYQSYGVAALSAVILPNDQISRDGNGFVRQASAGDKIIGIARDGATAGTLDGDVEVAVDISLTSLFAYPSSAGAVTAANLFTGYDSGGPQLVNPAAVVNADLFVVQIDTSVTPNLVYVRRQD